MLFDWRGAGLLFSVGTEEVSRVQTGLLQHGCSEAGYVGLAVEAQLVKAITEAEVGSRENTRLGSCWKGVNY